MHQKHPKIARPEQRTYGRIAYSLVGTTCARIEAIMESWLNIAGEDYRCLGVTGDHGEVTWASQGQHDSRQWMSPQGQWNEYDDRLQARTYDLALVNGNHYPAEKQIVFLDAQKSGTLERRSEQLTDIAAIVKVKPEDTVPHWLQAKLDTDQIEVNIYEFKNIIEILNDTILPTAQSRIPVLKALILAGGKSSRMGQDKAELVYRNGISESERLTEICRELGLEVHHSVQTTDPGAIVPQIGDRFLGLGPLGAIASAFLHEPDTAWLVLACDLPLLEKADLATLLAKRDSRKYATALRGASRPFPEPLIAIYEPRAYERILRFLSLGYACPRKVLINSDIATLSVRNEQPLTNANTPEERAKVIDLLNEPIR
ncbi:hypothetical protein CEQ90_15755 [Lewinellaceae bacterium SD302]|nr:hypothetical protein CEQ90_15755 [Lewinellaceae bacterium SD302]